MAERKKTKFEEELDKLLENIAANNEDWNDPLQKGMYDYRQFQNGTVVREDDPLAKHIKEKPIDTEAYFKTEPSPYPDSKYGWPTLAKEGEPAYNDPGLVLRNAVATAGDRRDRNIENANREFAQTVDDLDRNLNPESYGNRRSGRIVPAGGRAGLANLNRPQYIAAMNESVQAPKDAVRNHKALASANSLEAERNHAIGWLKGSEQHRAKLEKTIEEYDREIAKLQEEISMSEAGDPLYDLAIQRLIMDDDNSLLSDIRGRIAKRIDQEYQMKQKKADQEFQHSENELNRQNTLEVARMNKQEQIEAQQKELDNALASAKQLYEFALGDLEANPNDPKLKREVEKAKELFRQAAVKANKVNEFNEQIAANTNSKALWDEAGAAYGVTGQTGIKAFVDSIKDPKIKAAVIRDLENTYHITEGDLGYSGAEAKINEDKAAKRDALNTDIDNALKLGPWDDEESAKKALNGLNKNVKDALKVGYNTKTKKYILKKKVK